MAYDAYRDVPKDLRPTFADTIVLTEISRLIKEAVKIRHDFHTAIQLWDRGASVREAFIPNILSKGDPPAQRHLGAVPPWESGFAHTELPGSRTMAGLAARHKELALEAKMRTGLIRGNAKLAKLLREQIDAFFPDIGYSAASGTFLRRLRKDERSVLQAFQPLGVEDEALVIGMLLKRKFGIYYYW